MAERMGAVTVLTVPEGSLHNPRFREWPHLRPRSSSDRTACHRSSAPRSSSDRWGARRRTDPAVNRAPSRPPPSGSRPRTRETSDPSSGRFGNPPVAPVYRCGIAPCMPRLAGHPTSSTASRGSRCRSRSELGHDGAADQPDLDVRNAPRTPLAAMPPGASFQGDRRGERDRRATATRTARTRAHARRLPRTRDHLLVTRWPPMRAPRMARWLQTLAAVKRRPGFSNKERFPW